MKYKTLLLLSACVLLLAGCQKAQPKAEPIYLDPVVSEGELVIDKAQLSSDARYINYTSDGVTIQILAGIASDGSYRASLNTCQSCNPSPKAFFTYSDGILTCQNCGNQFTMDDVGISARGCNPMLVPYFETEDQITISTEVLADYRALFEAWTGPTE